MWKPRKIFYGWYMVAAGGITSFIMIGIPVFGFGVFINPIRQELGWSAATIAVGFSIRSFEGGLMAPFTGYMVDRLGPRIMALAGVVFLSAGLALFSQIQTVWMFYLSAMVMALGGSLGANTPFSAALVGWFNRHRGRALAFLNMGNGIGTFSVPGVIWLVAAFGWRESLLIIACIVFVIGIPLALTLRARPEPYGYLPDGDTPSGQDGSPTAVEGAQAIQRPKATGMEVRDALRVPALYLLVVANGAQGFAHQAWLVHLVPHLTNSGFSIGMAGLMVGIYGGLQVIIRLGLAWKGDSIGRRRILLGSYALQGSGLMVFAFVRPSLAWMLPLFYIAYGLGNAGWNTMSQTAIADYFGTRRYGTLRGLSSALQMPFGLMGPIVAGLMFDKLGNYTLIFAVSAIIMASGSLMILMIRRPVWADLQSSKVSAQSPPAMVRQPEARS